MEDKPLQRINDYIKKKVFDYWIPFNAFALIWFVVVLSVLFVFEQGVLFYVSGFIAILLEWFLLDVKVNVAEKAPRNFIKFDNLQRLISKIHWRFIYPTMVFLFLFAIFFPMKYPNLVEQVKPTFSLIFAGFVTLFIGTTIYQIVMIGNAKQLPTFLKARAEAYFRVTASSIDNPSIKKHGKIVRFLLTAFLNKKWEEIEQRRSLLRMFENGMNDLNDYIIYRYDLEFSNLHKYIDYFHYIICLEKCHETDRVRKAIDILGYKLSKKVELSEIMWSAKQILEEKPLITIEESIQDLDFKSGINRWYNHNKESVQISLLIVPIIISVIALLVFHV
jgi:hypothetical protein